MIYGCVVKTVFVSVTNRLITFCFVSIIFLLDPSKLLLPVFGSPFDTILLFIKGNGLGKNIFETFFLLLTIAVTGFFIMLNRISTVVIVILIISGLLGNGRCSGNYTLAKWLV